MNRLSHMFPRESRFFSKIADQPRMLVVAILSADETIFGPFVGLEFLGSLLKRRPSVILVLTCPLGMVQEAVLE